MIINLKKKMPRRNESDVSVCGFIQKLWEILQNSEFEKILLWNGSGNSFAILNPTRFEDTILPAYFRHSKLKSFVRQLNMYGFRKIQRSKDHLSFANPHFTRDSQQKLPSIRRKLAKRSRNAFKNDRTEEELEGLGDTLNDFSIQESPSLRGEEIAVSKVAGVSQTQNKEVVRGGEVFQIRSYGRLLGEERYFVPFVSPYSYASIKSQAMIGTVENNEGSFMNVDLFKNASTESEGHWPPGFTSCEYFL